MTTEQPPTACPLPPPIASRLSLKSFSRFRPLHLALTLSPWLAGVEGFLGAPLFCPGALSLFFLREIPTCHLLHTRLTQTLPGHEACSTRTRLPRVTLRPRLLHDTW